MPFALITNTEGTGNLNTVSSPATGISTAGANLIVVAAAWYSGVTADVTVTDNKGNGSPTAMTKIANSTATCRMFRWEAPIVGTDHQFTVAGVITAPSFAVTAWSGAAASPFDQENTNGSGVPYTTGSITPSEDNELLIAAIAWENGATDTASINGGFAISDQSPYVPGTSDGAAQANLIQTSAAAANPTWTLATSDTAARAIASFKAAASGGSSVHNLPLLGAG